MNVQSVYPPKYDWVKYTTLVLLGMAAGLALATLAIWLGSQQASTTVYTYDQFVRVSEVNCNVIGCNRTVL